MRKATQVALALPALMYLMSSLMAQTQDWPWLGVLITDISRIEADGFGAAGKGSYVTGVEYAGPASAAGLQRHDIIVGVDGQAVLNSRELTCLIQGRRPGDVIHVTVLRDGERHSMTATLGRWPDTRDFPRPAVGNCGRSPVS